MKIWEMAIAVFLGTLPLLGVVLNLLGRIHQDLLTLKVTLMDIRERVSLAARHYAGS